LIGYIPGIGFVDNSQPVFLLAEPVIERRGDVTIRVESAASDGQNTRINLRVEGLRNLTGQVEGEGHGDNHLTLHLQDGKTLILRGYQVSYQPTFTIRLDFAPLPEGAQEATLSFQVIPGVPQGAGPEEWVFPLRFTTSQANTSITEGSSVMLDSDPINGVVLRLLNVSRTANGTAVQVQLLSEIPNTFIVTSRTDKLYLLDSEGHFIPFVGEPLLNHDGPDTMTLITKEIASGQRLTLVLKGPQELTYQLDSSERLKPFSIDLGEKTEIGQHWDLDETFSINGKTIHLNGVQLIPGSFGSTTRLLFQMEPVDQVLGVRVAATDGQSITSGYGRMQVDFNEYPRGVITFTMVGIDYQVDGTWKVDWTMP
jgi:hypothetical protein